MHPSYSFVRVRRVEGEDRRVGAGHVFSGSWLSCWVEDTPVLAFCAKRIVLATVLDTYRVLSHFSHVRLFATPWPVARQAPLSMGFSRQEYCSGLPCPPPGDGEGNDTPLQYSCLENPMDGGTR